MNGPSTLPSCFGLHQPELPNSCEKCEVRALCYKVILRTDLVPTIKKIESILEGTVK